MEDKFPDRFDFLFDQKSPLLAYFAHGKREKPHIIHSMKDQKTHERRIPQLAQMRVLSCKYGWLVIGHGQTNPPLKREEKQHSYSHFSLINPLTMERIDLPPVPPLPSMNQHWKNCVPTSFWLVNITAPPTDDDCIIFLTDRHNPYIKFCYLREKKWFVREIGWLAFSSITTVNGIVYGLMYDGALVNVIFNKTRVTTKILNVERPQDIFNGNFSFPIESITLYTDTEFQIHNTRDFSFLIESEGELYNVRSVQNHRTRTIKGFIVFKMDFPHMKWVAVNNIGDRAFLLDFVTDGLSCAADDGTSLEKNCIYYIDKDHFVYQYDLEDTSVTMLRVLQNIEFPCLYPIWVSTQYLQDKTSSDNYTTGLKYNSEHTKYSENELDAPKLLPNQNISTTCGQEIESCPNIPLDIMEQIISRLSYLDSRCAGIGFPGWNRTIRSMQKPIGANWQHNDPCFLSFSADYKTCRLIDPMRNTQWLVKSPKISPPVKIVYCKHGWLLLMLSGQKLIFYNPLSEAVIDLPPKPHKEYWGACNFSFSTPPTSSDCVVVAEIFGKYTSWIIICRKGDREWIEIDTHDEVRNDYPGKCITPAVFSKDSFFWLHEGGVIGVLNLIKETYEVRGRTNKNVGNAPRQYLVEYDEEIFRVSTSKNGGWVCVYKLDRSNYRWQETYDLGGCCSFFLSQETSIATGSASSRGREERLYFPMLRNERFVYYSMQTRKLFPEEDFFGGKEILLNATWIVPHWAQHTSEELCWY